MADDPPSFSLGRRWNVRLNLLITLLSVLAVVAMVNYLAMRHFERFHLGAGTQLRLAARTLQVLRTVTNTVHVTVYYDAEDELFGRVTGLLKEYQAVCPKIEVERVDYLRDVAAAKAVKAKYNLTQVTDKNLVIFECAGRSRFVSSGELSDYDINSVVMGKTKEVRRTHFRGEMAFTSAIFNVINPRPLKAYFLRGHGEHNPESMDQAMGYSKLATILKDECNMPWDVLPIMTSTEVPADCSLLIAAGPVNAFSSEELEKMRHYLDHGGRMLALFNYYSVGKPTGLEKLLAAYGVAVGDNLVVDVENSIARTGKGIVPTELGSHPIVSRLQGSQVYLSMPRSIREAKTSSTRSVSTQVDALLLTGPNSIVVTDFRNGVPQVNPSDLQGSVPLMVAVERGAVPGVSAERGATRLAVIGDSFFLQNDGIESVANRDFAAHTVNWLVDQSVLLSGIFPRPVNSYRTTLTQTQLAATRFVLLLVVPGSVLLLGTLVWWRRRT